MEIRDTELNKIPILIIVSVIDIVNLSLEDE